MKTSLGTQQETINKLIENDKMKDKEIEGLKTSLVRKDEIIHELKTNDSKQVEGFHILKTQIDSIVIQSMIHKQCDF